MRAAIQDDLARLFKRIPDDHKDGLILEMQIREMRNAEKRAEKYGVEVPWHSAPWHGYVLLPDGTVEMPEPRKSAKVKSSSTGKGRIKTGEE